MHYVCFHYEFEHDPADPDDDCGVPGCPSAAGNRNVAQLADVASMLATEWASGIPYSWENVKIADYLDALASWLRDCDGYYANRGRAVPWSASELISDALQAARVYE